MELQFHLPYLSMAVQRLYRLLQADGDEQSYSDCAEMDEEALPSVNRFVWSMNIEHRSWDLRERTGSCIRGHRGIQAVGGSLRFVWLGADYHASDSSFVASSLPYETTVRFLAVISSIRMTQTGRNPPVRRQSEIDPVTPRILRSGRSRQLARSAVVGDRPMVRAFPRNTVLPAKNP